MKYLLIVLSLLLFNSQVAYGTTFRKFIEPPYQHVIFCKKFPTHCIRLGSLERVIMSQEKIAELHYINSWVNYIVKPRLDPKNNDIWTYPVDGYGDCEDYVIKKRAHLIALGWPTGSLLMTVVKDSLDRGHAVLTVRTNLGDLILDNNTSEIKNWSETNYTFHYRQSYLNPTRWISLK